MVALCPSHLLRTLCLQEVQPYRHPQVSVFSPAIPNAALQEVQPYRHPQVFSPAIPHAAFLWNCHHPHVSFDSFHLQ